MNITGCSDLIKLFKKYFGKLLPPIEKHLIFRYNQKLKDMLTKRYNELQRQADVLENNKPKMTKKEIRSAINKAVYIYAESLGYEMSDDNDGSYVTFYKPGTSKADDTIDYSRSYHSTCTLNWASDQVKSDAELIDKFSKQQQAEYKQ